MTLSTAMPQSAGFSLPEIGLKRLRLMLLGLLLAHGAAGSVGAAEEVSEKAGLDFFEKKIRPALVQHCYECHSAKSRIVQAGLLLDSREGIRKGGDSGPSVVPGDVARSLLIDALRYDGLEMPPKGKLPPAVVADFVRWVEIGAPDPRDAAVARPTSGQYTSLEVGRKFWSFQPLRRPVAPAVKDGDWPTGFIDRFVLAKLEAEGVAPSRDAAPAVLARRLSFDLLGLPPTPEQVDDFVRDPSPARYEKLVDELLASPHFGERWGRHWLDVARFAETSGGGRSLVFPDAWRYRDYVIEAFHRDLPYDQFLTQQIAGDLLPSASEEERARLLAATGFLAIGPTNFEFQDKDVLELDVVDEQLDTMGRVVLGMTIGCARCHDHKFDPIPTRDYYALAGIMMSTKTLIHENVSRWVELPLPMDAELADRVDRHEREVAALRRSIAAAKTALKGTETAVTVPGVVKPKDLPGIVLDDTDAKRVGKWRDSTFSGRYIGSGTLYDDRASGVENTLTFVPEFPADGRYEVRLAYVAHTNRSAKTPVTILHADGETTTFVNQQKPPEADGRFVSLGTFRFDRNGQWFVLVSSAGATGHVSVDAVQFLPEAFVEESPAIAEVPAADSAEALPTEADLKAMESELKKLQSQAPKKPVAMGVEEGKTIGDIRICIRGNRTNPGDIVPRGFLRATMSPDLVTTPPSEWMIPAESSGRLQLARWLTRPENPLTARVMVNRLWHHLFGVGIVRTTDLFGTTGEKPSHPELLDALACEFQEPTPPLAGSSPSGKQAPRWSVKSMIRLIVLSRTYRMSSDARTTATTSLDGRPDAAAKDPENRWLWRQNRRRLEAECLRDAMLSAGGALDLTVGGPNMKIGPEGEYGYQFTDFRRSVYTPVLRNRLHELFEVFDFADPNLVMGRRNVSTEPTQALFLMNSPFALTAAGLAARSIQSSPQSSQSDRIGRAYRTTLGRGPSPEELQTATAFLNAADETKEAREAAWTRLFQALFASLEFRYVR